MHIHVCEHMCMHIHVRDQWTIMQLHILFEGEVIGMLNNDGIRCSITIVHCVCSVGNCCTTLLVHSRHFDNSNNVVVVGRTWEM